MKLSHFLYCLKRAAAAVFTSRQGSPSLQLRKTFDDSFDMMNMGNTMPVDFPETGSSVDGPKSSDYENAHHPASVHAPEHAHSHHDAAHLHDSFHASDDHSHSFDASPSDSCGASSSGD